MIFREGELRGVYIIEPEYRVDDRGFFARIWCQHEFEVCRLNPRLAQCNVSFNHKRGTLRGMHYQLSPHAEVKIVRCTRGGIYDVALDLRPDSPTYKRWQAVELTDRNRLALYIPEGVAHGYQTLTDNTEVYYQVSEFYSPDSEAGIRWNDPALAIRWPLLDPIVSSKDARWPDFRWNASEPVA